ncbi:MAG: hypothetical protein GOU98_02485 [Candidatus Altiarchaeota archaeon]|nr:hypothetical protein [Candidatus Altiarchaeota archaeon]
MERNEEPLRDDQVRQIQMMKRILLRKGMSSDARERLGRIKVANPELAEKVEMIALQFIQQGKTINDEVLKELLSRLTPKRDIKIRRI